MRYWLMKTEPETFSWQDHVEHCEDHPSNEWDGVRNPRARNNMMAMSLGDRVFFYHTSKERQIVGISEVVGTAHPDSTDPGWQTGEGKWQCVDLRPVRPFVEPVTLKSIKAEPDLADMTLVRNSRLSVQSVTDEQWHRVCEMGKTAPA